MTPPAASPKLLKLRASAKAMHAARLRKEKLAKLLAAWPRKPAK
jgi:hypothetical protein